MAARNVLVGENHRCKITDFGMARDVNLEEIYIPRNEVIVNHVLCGLSNMDPFEYVFRE